MTNETFERLEYVIKHEPVQYIVKRELLFFWVVRNVSGDIVEVPTLYKHKAIVRCELLNGIFSYGYTCGCNAVIKALKIDL